MKKRLQCLKNKEMHKFGIHLKVCIETKQVMFQNLDLKKKSNFKERYIC